MSIRYREHFQIGFLHLGIEDYEDGQPLEDHFIGRRYKSGKVGDSKRFRLWVNGAGFGQADTLEEARNQTHRYARRRLKERVERARAELEVSNSSLELLAEDPAFLFRFEVK